jgi:hypothetical protein
MDIPDNLTNFPGSDVFNVIDSTKIRCFKSCPRQFFYNYVLHWRTDSPNIHLEFGTAWHLAKEHLFNHGWSDANVNEAYALFLSHFRKFFSESDDMNLAPKNASNALSALREYTAAFRGMNERLTVLGSEVAGRVRLSDDFDMSVKIDLIVRDSTDMVWILDHKTASRDSPTYDESYFLSDQMYAYTNALFSMYPAEDVAGAYVDISVLRKTGNLHKRLPIRRTFDHIEEWHQTILYWAHLLRLEYLQLSAELDANLADAKHMAAFPKNTESCTKYGRCPYMSLCLQCGNPMTGGADEPPQGFRREVWNPHAGDKAWQPKLILEPDGSTHEPTADDLRAYTEARAVFEEQQKHSELDGFNFEGLL